MIDPEKYSFKGFMAGYKRRFTAEKARLQRILPQASIEHVGSSAVEGLGGKGIIDVAIAVPKAEMQQAVKRLEGHGYDFRPTGGDAERSFFQRIICHDGKEQRVHIHLTFCNSSSWRSMLAVRDYLRSHPDAREEYERVKQEAIRYAQGEGKKYRAYKKDFLQNIEKLALEEDAV